MAKLFYIRNAKTDQNFDPIEGKFFGANWEPQTTDDKVYLETLIAGNPDKFQDCKIEEVTTDEAIAIVETVDGFPWVSIPKTNNAPALFLEWLNEVGAAKLREIENDAANGRFLVRLEVGAPGRQKLIDYINANI